MRLMPMVIHAAIAKLLSQGECAFSVESGEPTHWARYLRRKVCQSQCSVSVMFRSSLWNSRSANANKVGTRTFRQKQYSCHLLLFEGVFTFVRLQAFLFAAFTRICLGRFCPLSFGLDSRMARNKTKVKRIVTKTGSTSENVLKVSKS